MTEGERLALEQEKNQPAVPIQQEQEVHVDGNAVVDFIKNNLRTTADIAKGIISGPTKLLEDTLQTGHDIANVVDNKVFDGRYVDDDYKFNIMHDMWRPETSAGEVAQTLTAYAAGYMTFNATAGAAIGNTAIVKGLADKAPKLVGAGKELVTSGVVSAITQDPSSEQLADLLIRMPQLNNTLTRYLASDPDDSAAEARFKIMLQDIMLTAGVIGGAKAGKALYKTFRGIKEVNKGMPKTVEVALADRKRITEALNIERAQQILKENELTVNVTNSGTLTKEAQLYYAKQALKNEPENVLKQVRDITGHAGKDVGINKDKFTAGQTLIEDLNEAVKFMFKNDHMDMREEASKAIENYIKYGADGETLKKALVNKPDIERITTCNAYIQYCMGPQYEIAIKNIADGADGAMQQLRKVVADGYEIMAHLKRIQYKYGQGVKAGDGNRFIPEIINNRVSKATAEKAAKLNIMELIPDPAKFAKEAVDAIPVAELEHMARAVALRHKNGGDVIEVLVATLAQDNVLKKATEETKMVWDSVLKHRYAAMLSGLRTHIANATGTASKSLVVAAENLGRNIVQGYQEDGLVGALHGAEDGINYFRGLGLFSKETLQNMDYAMEHMHSMSRPSDVTQIAKGLIKKTTGSQKGIAGNIADKSSESVFKALHIVDEALTSQGGFAKTYEICMRDLRKSGILKGVKDKEVCEALRTEFFRQHMETSFMKVVMPDGKVSKYGKFALQEAVDITADIGLRRQLSKTSEGLIAWARNNPVAHFIFPFLRTPMNIMSDVLWKRGPLGLPQNLYRTVMSGEPAKRAEAIVNIASGAALWGAGYELFVRGMLTGRTPANTVAKDAQYANQVPPYSIKIGDTYHSLERMEPFGIPMMIMADFMQLSNQQGAEDAIEFSDVFWGTMIHFIANRSYFSGLSNLIQDANNGTTISGFLTDTVLSFAPNILTEMSQSMDPIVRDTRTWQDKAFKKVGLTYSLAPSVWWVTGEDKRQLHGGGLGAFNPLRSTESREDLVFEELSKVTGIGNPRRRIGNIDLSPHEYADYCRLIGTVKDGGKTLYESLETLIMSDQYDVNRRRVDDPAMNVLHGARNKALVDVMRHYQDLGEAEWQRQNSRYRNELLDISQPNLLLNISNY